MRTHFTAASAALAVALAAPIPDAAAQQTGDHADMVGAVAVDPSGYMLGEITDIVSNEDGGLRVVVTPHADAGRMAERPAALKENAGVEGLAKDAGAVSGERDEYVSGWRASLDQWGDAVADRAGDLEAEAGDELEAAWTAVEDAWAEMREETDENWTRARDAFEAAFEAFEESWAEDARSG